jgi:dipeptidyl aminopeptidase/acylaminoacyl peptidase
MATPAGQAMTAPYGTWSSPISSDLIIAKTVGLSGPAIDGNDIVWIEARPNESGRNVIVRLRNGQASELNAAPSNARSRVHEYGGGAVLVSQGQVYFTDFHDQQIYRVEDHGCAPITANPGLRYADYVHDVRRGSLIAVREDHRNVDSAAHRQCVNCIVMLPLGNTARLTPAAADAEVEPARVERILVGGNDFYSNPRLSPDGKRLAWLSWNHPNMPWDGCELWVAEVDDNGQLSQATQVAGGPTESIFQPEWSPDGQLHFVAEHTGWWNLYRLNEGSQQPEALARLDAEFGLPMWVFGQSTYGFISPGQILCTYSQRGESKLALLDTTRLMLHELATPYSSISGISAAEGQAVFQAASPTCFAVIVHFDLASMQFRELKHSSDLDLQQLDGFLSVPQAIEFPTENNLSAHAFYYPPTNRDFAAPVSELPLVLVKSHGGPTGSSNSSLKLSYQYWTSRGIGVLDVNYGGSTGYGRAYRQRLNGAWGVVDTDDCVNAARYLVAQGMIDGDRLMISGGSAGGYTTLCALTFRNLFKAGASYYGVSDAEALAKDTHKFESRYLDSMIGPYPAQRALYVARSPIHFAQRIASPILFLQGLEDKVVPPDQSEAMFKALLNNGIATAYLTFAGEQHGFRKAENIKRALQAELYFYGKVFGFEPAEQIEPIDIKNARRLP